MALARRALEHVVEIHRVARWTRVVRRRRCRLWRQAGVPTDAHRVDRTFVEQQDEEENEDWAEQHLSYPSDAGLRLSGKEKTVYRRNTSSRPIGSGAGAGGA